MSDPLSDFSGWVDAHYINPQGPQGPGRGKRMICRRCGQPVGYLTKHAVVRHGDKIEIMPVSNSNRSLVEDF